MTPMEFNGTTSDWSIWAKYVLKTLEDLKDQYASNEKKIEGNKTIYIDAINALRVDLAKHIGEIKGEIKVINTRITLRATLVGALAGFIPALIAFIYFMIKLKTSGL